MRAQGYEGTWFWSAPGASLKPRRGAPRVGPALLVRSARFRVRARAAIAFRHARCAADLSGGHEPTAALLAGCRDGAVAVFLEDKTTGATLLAASVHVNWDYRTPDLKVLQVAALMAELRAFWEGAVGGGSGASGLPPLILGGDFNSLPLDRPSNEAPGAPSCPLMTALIDATTRVFDAMCRAVIVMLRVPLPATVWSVPAPEPELAVSNPADDRVTLNTRCASRVVPW